MSVFRITFIYLYTLQKTGTPESGYIMYLVAFAPPFFRPICNL